MARVRFQADHPPQTARMRSCSPPRPLTPSRRSAQVQRQLDILLGRTVDRAYWSECHKKRSSVYLSLPLSLGRERATLGRYERASERPRLSLLLRRRRPVVKPISMGTERTGEARDGDPVIAVRESGSGLIRVTSDPLTS
jgi:hypothetical protein